MVCRPEKMALFGRAKEKALSRALVGLALLAMAAWIYLLSRVFLKFVLWCMS
jgi:hypothetical protein